MSFWKRTAFMAFTSLGLFGAPQARADEESVARLKLALLVEGTNEDAVGNENLVQSQYLRAQKLKKENPTPLDPMRIEAAALLISLTETLATERNDAKKLFDENQRHLREQQQNRNNGRQNRNARQQRQEDMFRTGDLFLRALGMDKEARQVQNLGDNFELYNYGRRTWDRMDSGSSNYSYQKNTFAWNPTGEIINAYAFGCAIQALSPDVPVRQRHEALKDLGTVCKIGDDFFAVQAEKMTGNGSINSSELLSEANNTVKIYITPASLQKFNAFSDWVLTNPTEQEYATEIRNSEETSSVNILRYLQQARRYLDGQQNPAPQHHHGRVDHGFTR